VTIKTKVFAKSHYLTQFYTILIEGCLDIWKTRQKYRFFCSVEKRERDHQ